MYAKYCMNAISHALQIKAELFRLCHVGLGKHHPNSTSPFPFYFTRWLLKTIFFCIITNSTNMIFTSSYPPLAEIPQCNVIEFLFQNPNKIPDDHPMLVDAITNDCLTYGDLRQRILEFAAGLQDQCNFKKGDSLLLCSPNHVSIISIQSLCIVIYILSSLVDISMSIQFH